MKFRLNMAQIGIISSFFTVHTDWC